MLVTIFGRVHLVYPQKLNKNQGGFRGGPGGQMTPLLDLDPLLFLITGDIFIRMKQFESNIQHQQYCGKESQAI